jgi:hypothetical protein
MVILTYNVLLILSLTKIKMPSSQDSSDHILSKQQVEEIKKSVMNEVDTAFWVENELAKQLNAGFFPNSTEKHVVEINKMKPEEAKKYLIAHGKVAVETFRQLKEGLLETGGTEGRIVAAVILEMDHEEAQRYLLANRRAADSFDRQLHAGFINVMQKLEYREIANPDDKLKWLSDNWIKGTKEEEDREKKEADDFLK